MKYTFNIKSHISTSVRTVPLENKNLDAWPGAWVEPGGPCVGWKCFGRKNNFRWSVASSWMEAETVPVKTRLAHAH